MEEAFAAARDKLQNSKKSPNKQKQKQGSWSVAQQEAPLSLSELQKEASHDTYNPQPPKNEKGENLTSPWVIQTPVIISTSLLQRNGENL